MKKTKFRKFKTWIGCSEGRENSKIRSGGLLKKRKPRNQDSIWRASEERKTKKPRFVRSGGLLKNENLKIRSGGLPKNENQKIKIRSGGLLCGKTKIRSGGVGFRPSGKEEPRFVRSGGLLTFGKRETKIRFGLASDFWKSGTKIHKSRMSRMSSEERKKPKIRKFGWIAKE
ncbi:unnamed protein product [Rhizophagus irregularis]|nr:unnamed protein product [Rhizophagus irregularis]